MTDRIFFDTAPCIYALEGSSVFSLVARAVIQKYCEAGCGVFLTNDKRLRQVKEISVVTVDDLARESGRYDFS